MDVHRFAVVVPTLNAGHAWQEWIAGMRIQRVKPDIVLVVDSSSTDETVPLALQEGYRVHEISRSEFNHGRTRQLAVDMLGNVDIVVMLTQDAQLDKADSLGNIVSSFANEKVGVAYGRQLPRRGAGLSETHARLFNYPPVSRLKRLEDAPVMGVKTAYTSNSYAAYRLTALRDVGGFPDNVIVSEDMHVAARMLVAGWYVHYNAEATVMHSHNYTPLQEFQRYFDVGVFLSHEPWILERFGKPGGEGWRFVISEIQHGGLSGLYMLPISVMRSALKYVGYILGKREKYLPDAMKIYMSMQKGFWQSID
jgi:rhamnosyltransferase